LPGNWVWIRRFQAKVTFYGQKGWKKSLAGRQAGLFIAFLIAVSLIALAIFNFMPDDFKNSNSLRGKTLIQLAHNTSGLPLKAQKQLKRMPVILNQYQNFKNPSGKR